jgi:hypothetical protein
MSEEINEDDVRIFYPITNYKKLSITVEKGEKTFITFTMEEDRKEALTLHASSDVKFVILGLRPVPVSEISHHYEDVLNLFKIKRVR